MNPTAVSIHLCPITITSSPIEITPSVIFTNDIESGELLKWDNGAGISF